MQSWTHFSQAKLQYQTENASWEWRRSFSTHTHTHTHTQTHIHTYTHVHIHTHTHATHTHTQYTHTQHTHTLNAHTHTYTHIHIHTDTHTHTHARSIVTSTSTACGCCIASQISPSERLARSVGDRTQWAPSSGSYRLPLGLLWCSANGSKYGRLRQPGQKHCSRALPRYGASPPTRPPAPWYPPDGLVALPLGSAGGKSASSER